MAPVLEDALPMWHCLQFECEVPEVDYNGFDGIQLKMVMKLVSDVPLALLGLEFRGGPLPHCLRDLDEKLKQQISSLFCF